MARRAPIVAAISPTVIVALAIVLAAPGPAPSLQAPSPGLALTAAGGQVRIANSSAGEAVIGAVDWVPGQVSKGHLSIANHGAATVAVRLSISRSEDVEGIGGGTLGRAMSVRVLRDRPVLGKRMVVYDGPLRKLRRIEVGDWRVGGTRTFRIQARLASHGDEPDNSYQAAELSFDLTWAARSAD